MAYTRYHADWQDSPSTATPIVAAALEHMENGIAAAQAAIDAITAVPINAQTGTTYTAALADSGKLVTLSNAAAITVTLPSNASVALPIGSVITWVWLGVGQPTFVAGSGATVNAAPGLKLLDRYSSAQSVKIATNTWLLIGRLSV